MDGCLLCRAPARALLCDTHESSLTATVTAEQVRARVSMPTATLVGAGGIAVPVGDATTVGRDPACDLALLCASVSSRHARIFREHDWWIEDLGSTNGTWVDGRPVAGRTALTPGARVRIADLELYFWPAPIAAAPPRRRRRTTLPGVTPLELRVDLTRRERRLVEILAERRRVAPDPELAYVSSSEIAQVLGFHSIDADGDNVRELVLRVRKKLRAAGAGTMIETRRGAGYRLAGEVHAPRAAA